VILWGAVTCAYALPSFGIDVSEKPTGNMRNLECLALAELT
jgi:hypothetical protein